MRMGQTAPGPLRAVLGGVHSRRCIVRRCMEQCSGDVVGNKVSRVCVAHRPTDRSRKVEEESESVGEQCEDADVEEDQCAVCGGGDGISALGRAMRLQKRADRNTPKPRRQEQHNKEEYATRPNSRDSRCSRDSSATDRKSMHGTRLSHGMDARGDQTVATNQL